LCGVEQVFRANSLFDPDVTNAGHQPYGFDTLSSIYTRYKVESVEFEFVHSGQQQSAGSYGTLVLSVSPPANPVTLLGVAVEVLMEKPGVVTVPIQEAFTKVPPAALRGRFNIRDLVGLTEQQFDADIEDYSALVTANPTNVPLIKYAVASNSANVISSAGSIVFTRIVYHAVFWDRVSLAQS